MPVGCRMRVCCKQVGWELVAIMCDANRFNQSFFRKFDTHIVKPWCTKVDTFLLFDYVHLLRNICNKWITEKTQELSFELNCEQMTAKWWDIQKLDQLEISSLVKMSKLSKMVRRPKPIERQKVSTVLQALWWND